MNALNITRNPARLIAPAADPDGRTYRYGVAAPFQVAPGLAALTISIRNEGYPVGDFENGSDLILFDNLESISADNAIMLCRNDKNVREDGEKRIGIKYPIRGAFIPFGALREDGSPHPHAGTGFGLSEVLDFPMLGDGYYDKAHKKTSMVRHTQIDQFAYDGRSFKVTHTGVYPPDKALSAPTSEWAIIGPSLTEGVPDGDDLLFPVLTTADPDAWMCKRMSSGVTRWRRSAGTWQVVSYSPVTIDENVQEGRGAEHVPDGQLWMEPSLVRDSDGSLLFTARGAYGEVDNLLKVWRSRDGAETWEEIIVIPNGKAQSTICLGRLADGTPYIVANEYGRERDKLCLWPLNDARDGLMDPVTARDALDEFGPPPSGIVWFMDHPASSTVQFGDGTWHHLLSYRIMDRGEHSGDDPPPESGQYVEEVTTEATPKPVWRFE